MKIKETQKMRNRLERAVEALNEAQKSDEKARSLSVSDVSENLHLKIMKGFIIITTNKTYIELTFEEFEALINAGNNMLLKTPDKEENKTFEPLEPLKSGEYMRGRVKCRKFKVPAQNEKAGYFTIDALVDGNIELYGGEYIFINGKLFIAIHDEMVDSCDVCDKPRGVPRCALSQGVCRPYTYFKKVKGWLPA